MRPKFTARPPRHLCNVVFRPLGSTRPNERYPSRRLDFVKPGRPTNLLCKGTFPVGTGVMPPHFTPLRVSLQYNRTCERLECWLRERREKYGSQLTPATDGSSVQQTDQVKPSLNVGSVEQLPQTCVHTCIRAYGSSLVIQPQKLALD